jgi:SAM-dependent methyltransferase
MDLPYEMATCPVCDSRDEEEVASRDEIEREIAELWEFHLRRLRPGTPRRYLTDRVVFSQDPPLRLGRCRACGTLYRNPRERGRELVSLYADEELDAEVLRGLFAAQLHSYRTQAARLARAAGAAGRALEVGSYVGGFQAAAREIGWEVEGVDVNGSAVAFARNAGFRVHEGEIDAVPEGRTFDAVAIWNCFDQLPRPRETLRAAKRLLRPGGLVVVRVPNGGFYASVRKALTGPASGLARAMLAHNNLLGFPYRTGYTGSSLAKLVRSEGFEVAETVGDTLVAIADRWTRGWARWEERAVKRMLAVAAPGARAPWIELYARAGDTPGDLG